MDPITFATLIKVGLAIGVDVIGMIKAKPDITEDEIIANFAAKVKPRSQTTLPTRPVM